MNRKVKLGRFVLYVFLSVLFLISVFPFYWMFTGMTNTSVDIIKGNIGFGTNLLNNFTMLFSNNNMIRVLYNSIIISFFSVFGSLLVTSMAAYGFQIYPSKMREKVYTIMLLSMMVPFATLMIPLFRLIVRFNLLDSHLGVILAYLASVFLIFFFRQSFKSYPLENIQAARVDGAGELRIFFTIVVPSMKATFAAAAIYSYMLSWNSYLWPLLVLQSDNQRTVTLLISSLSSAYFPEFGVIMTAIVIATLPMIVIFFTMQKHFVQGMIGSLK